MSQRRERIQTPKEAPKRNNKNQHKRKQNTKNTQIVLRLRCFLWNHKKLKSGMRFCLPTSHKPLFCTDPMTEIRRRRSCSRGSGSKPWYPGEHPMLAFKIDYLDLPWEGPQKGTHSVLTHCHVGGSEGDDLWLFSVFAKARGKEAEENRLTYIRQGWI